MESLLFPSAMSSNSSSLSEEPNNNTFYTLDTTTPTTTTFVTRAAASTALIREFEDFSDNDRIPPFPQQLTMKKKRSLPGNPDPDAEVIALSPKTLLATNRFLCEICNKGFQRDQNLQLHRRGHNLPWKLKKRSFNGKDQTLRKRAYVCPEPSCVHHHPSRALGDLTGIKKHYCRKHGEKKWKCEKCSKVYAVQSDWKAHSKTCGTREYRCDCGTLFARKDSFITHRAFCDALAEESARMILANQHGNQSTPSSSELHHYPNLIASQNHNLSHIIPFPPQNLNPNPNTSAPSSYYFSSLSQKSDAQNPIFSNWYPNPPPPLSQPLSATALLQKAATIGATTSSRVRGSVTNDITHLGAEDLEMAGKVSGNYNLGFGPGNLGDLLMKQQTEGEITRDFLGL